MKNKLVLPSGATFGYDGNGARVCTGSQMGRRDELPDDPEATIKLRLERLKWVDGDYDQWGAYWGNGSGDSVYCAWAQQPQKVKVFVRARSRDEAKAFICETLPNTIVYQ